MKTLKFDNFSLPTPLSLSLSSSAHSLSLPHSLSLSLSSAHTLTHAQALIHSLSPTLKRSLSLFHTHTHTQLWRAYTISGERWLLAIVCHAVAGQTCLRGSRENWCSRGRQSLFGFTLLALSSPSVGFRSVVTFLSSRCRPHCVPHSHECETVSLSPLSLSFELLLHIHIHTLSLSLSNSLELSRTLSNSGSVGGRRMNIALESVRPLRCTR
jgi:hypothetical protein